MKPPTPYRPDPPPGQLIDWTQPPPVVTSQGDFQTGYTPNVGRDDQTPVSWREALGLVLFGALMGLVLLLVC